MNLVGILKKLHKKVTGFDTTEKSVVKVLNSLEKNYPTSGSGGESTVVPIEIDLTQESEHIIFADNEIDIDETIDCSVIYAALRNCQPVWVHYINPYDPVPYNYNKLIYDWCIEDNDDSTELMLSGSSIDVYIQNYEGSSDGDQLPVINAPVIIKMPIVSL